MVSSLNNVLNSEVVMLLDFLISRKNDIFLLTRWQPDMSQADIRVWEKNTIARTFGFPTFGSRLAK